LNVSAFVDLAAAFQRRFRIVHADGADLLDVCYRLRHAVYCEEFAFEPTQKDGRETDEWDSESVHCLVQNIPTGAYVGCARLVVPSDGDPRMPLPFERICASAIDRTIVDPQHLPRDSIAEISRLAVISDFRRSSGARVSRDAPSEASKHERRAAPCIMAGLYLGLLALAHVHNIDTVFMLVEQRLARYLSILSGCRPQIIGRSVEHRGPRIPTMLQVSDIFDGLNVLVQPLFAAISTDIRSGPPLQRRRTNAYVPRPATPLVFA
jgi:N-acyl amino acid synthase of PEP-CTERM/exosortase system